jgi:hypothetical protein
MNRIGRCDHAKNCIKPMSGYGYKLQQTGSRLKFRRLGGLGKRRELPQRGPGRSPAANACSTFPCKIFTILEESQWDLALNFACTAIKIVYFQTQRGPRGYPKFSHRICTNLRGPPDRPWGVRTPGPPRPATPLIVNQLGWIDWWHHFRSVTLSKP